MSIEAMNWAYQQQVGSPTTKAVLVCLGNIADPEGKAWPSINYIAGRVEMSRRAVIDNLKRLEEGGFLSREIRAGDGSGRKSNLYTLSLPGGQSAASAHRGKVQHLHQQSADNAGQSAASAPKQSLNNQSNNQPPLTPPCRTSRFDEWWDAYDKKVKKKSARDTWKRKKLDRFADRIVRDTQLRHQKDGRWLRGYQPDPTTYLNQERWEDELEPAGKKADPLDVLVDTPDRGLPEFCRKFGLSPQAPPGVDYQGWRQTIAGHLRARA